MALSGQRALSGASEADDGCAEPISPLVSTNLPSDSRRITLADDASRVRLSEQRRMMSSLGQMTGLAPASTGNVSSQIWSAPPRVSASAMVDFPDPDGPRKATPPPAMRTALPFSHVIEA